MIGKGIPQRLGVANQDAACLQRRVQPLMRVDGYGVCFLQALEFLWNCRGCKCAISAVHVEPSTVLPADRRDLCKWIDRSGAHRASRSDHQQGRHTLRPILLETTP